MAATLGSCLALASCDGTLSTSEPASAADQPGVALDEATIAEGVTPAPTPRFARLTHAQWENSVRDLLALDQASGWSSTFPSDPKLAGFVFDNDAAALQTDQALASAYSRAAEELAAEVTSNLRALSRILPRGIQANRDGARAFIESFGLKAFRRPLAQDEVDAFLSLYDTGQALYDDQDGFQAGARLVLEGFLQSPLFLYRVETSAQPNGTAIPLSPWEVGQRLSYLIIDSTPDADLLEAAASGALSSTEGVRQQALRLIQSPQARPALVGFHAQLLEFEKYVGASPSPSAYPGISDQFGVVARESGERFVGDLAFNQLGSFADLMTSSGAFVNDELAAVYGLSGGAFGRELEAVELPPDQRAGILHQVGFLASNATSVHPDPIHRGVFVATRVMCLPISAPPDGVPPLPPIAGGTNRQIVERHTQSTPTCRTCHEPLINPFGFAFEHYDATGAYRETDGGFPVDSEVSPLIDGERVLVDDSVEMAHAIAESPRAHECFAGHLVEYALGRKQTPLDAPLVAQLTEASLGGASILDLVVQLAQSPAFTQRSAEELP